MHIQDLTHALAHGDASFPNDPNMEITPFCRTPDSEYNLSLIRTGTHQGTHLDAMFHFYHEGKTLEQMPLEWFYGPASVLRIPKKRGESIDTVDLQIYEERITPGARILLDTGWQSEFGSPAFFEGFPSLTQEAARYLASRKIRLLGMDMPSLGVDYYELHRILLAPDVEIVVVESLANLDRIPDEITYSGFPLPYVGLDGSPIRAVATW